MFKSIRPFCILFFITMIGGTDALKGNCNKEEDLVQRCSMALPVLSSPDMSIALTRDELDKSCVELSAGIRCIDNYTETCMQKHEQVVFRRIYSGIAGAVRELCARGPYQDEYLAHAVCVKSVRADYEQCSRTYELTLTTLSERAADRYVTDGDGSQEHHLRTVCCSFQEYIRCSENTVLRACGTKAAMFTSAFLKKMSSKIIMNFCLEYRDQECGFSGAPPFGSLSWSLTLVVILLNAVLVNDLRHLVTT